VKVQEQIPSILKQFTSKQRLFVLIIILFFVSVTSIVTAYLTSDYNKCSDIVKENRELIEDYIKISKMIRESETPATETGNMMDSSGIILEESTVETTNPLMDSILVLSEKHLKH
jgi:5-methylcytosine-specific restriction endonuclease McrBC regulatory subunit McrC